MVCGSSVVDFGRPGVVGLVVFVRAVTRRPIAFVSTVIRRHRVVSHDNYRPMAGRD